MSELIKEDDKYLYLERYLHDETGEFSEWEMDGSEHKYPQKIQEAEHFAFYEIRASYRINKITGDVEYLSFE